jgi:hypothetical protein
MNLFMSERISIARLPRSIGGALENISMQVTVGNKSLTPTVAAKGLVVLSGEL